MTGPLQTRGLQLALACSLATTGCTSIDRTRPEADAHAGRVAVQLDAPGAEGSHRLGPGQSAVPPDFYDRAQPLPHYPAALLDARLEPVTVATLLSIDEQGNLANVRFAEDVPPVADCTRACVEGLRAAVLEVLPTWQFGPLEIIGFVDGPDEDGDGTADSVRREVVARRPYSLRLRFTFEQADGLGVVRSAVAD